MDLVLDDATIRMAMRDLLVQKGSNRLIISELGIEQGTSRVDLAVVDDQALWLYEIKGETDTLKRLPLQAEFYSRVADYAVLAVAANHLKKSVDIIPPWWGVLEVRKGIIAPNPLPQPTFTVYRKPQPNPSLEALSLVQLLWRDEAWKALRKLGRGRGLSSANRMTLWVALAEAADINVLRQIVRDTLRNRENWLSGERGLRQPD